MLKEVHGGASRLTLTADITASSTTFTGAGTSLANWPTGVIGPFVVRIDDELILCASRSAGAFTVAQRGWDNTGPAGHVAGELKIRHVLDADSVADFFDHIYDDVRDDHQQYVRTDGSRQFTSLATVSGAPVPIGTVLANGSSELVARADHVHTIPAASIESDKLEAGALTPVGGLMDFAGPSAPTGWLLCDGKEYAVATYPALDAVIGATWGRTNGSGGAGTSHFKVPDFRGRAAVAPDQMGGTDAGRLVAGALAGSGGAELVALTAAQLPGHTHGVAIQSGAQSANHSHGVAITSGPGGLHSHTVGGGYFQPVIGVSIGSGVHQLMAAGQGTGALLEFTTIDNVGDHAHGVNGNTAGVSADHSHGVNGNTDTGAGLTNAAHNNMPPYLLVNKIIYAGV